MNVDALTADQAAELLIQAAKELDQTPVTEEERELIERYESAMRRNMLEISCTHDPEFCEARILANRLLKEFYDI